MLVVADSSPLIALVNIGHIEILPQLFGAVILPARIVLELQSPIRPDAVRRFITAAPAWITIQEPAVLLNFPDLDAGEIQAISLAKELNADILLMDERRGHACAIAAGLFVIRTAALITEAANRGLLNLESAFDRLRQTDFRISEATLQTLLARHRTLKGAKDD